MTDRHIRENVCVGVGVSERENVCHIGFGEGEGLRP